MCRRKHRPLSFLATGQGFPKKALQFEKISDGLYHNLGAFYLHKDAIPWLDPDRPPRCRR